MIDLRSDFHDLSGTHARGKPEHRVAEPILVEFVWSYRAASTHHPKFLGPDKSAMARALPHHFEQATHAGTHVERDIGFTVLGREEECSLVADRICVEPDDKG